MTTSSPIFDSQTAVGFDEQEAALVAGMRRGDSHAIERIVTLHGPRMLAVAKRFLRDENDANDAVQDAFIGAFRNSASFEGQSRLSTWLHRVTVNACLMKRRAASRRHEVNVDDLQPSFDATGHYARPIATWDSPQVKGVMQSELRDQVRACIDQLPEAYRTVLLLRDIEEMDTDEAAKVLGCSEGCVKTRLHRARAALRELLEPMFAAT